MVFQAGRIRSTLEVDRRPWQEGIRQARAEAAKLARERYTARLDLDVDPKKALARFRADLQKIEKTPTRHRVDVDLTSARAQVREFQRELAGAGGDRRVSLTARAVDEATGPLLALEQVVNRIDGRTATVTARADLDRAIADLAAYDRLVSGLDGRTVRTTAELDTGQAFGELAAWDGLLGALDGRQVRTTAEFDAAAALGEAAAYEALVAGIGGRSPVTRPEFDGSGIAAGASMAQGRIATLALVIGSLVPLLGTVAVVGAGALGGIGAGATLALPGLAAAGVGVMGVGSALQAVTAQQDKAGAAATKSGAAAAASADAQKSAAEGLARAERGVSDAREAAAAGVEAARDRAVAAESAVRDALRDRRRAYEEIGATQSRVAEQVASAARTEQRARDALNESYKTARERIEDLQFASIGGALAERRAVLNLQSATDELNDARRAGLTGRELEAVTLSYEEARLALDRQRVANRRTADEKADSDRRGVAGSKEVTAAQERLNDAVRAREKAESDGARQVEAARERAAQAEERVAKAQKSAADAQAAIGKAYRDGQRRIEDALVARGAAERAVAAAARRSAEATTGGAAAVDKAREAMAKLSPEGREFVAFLARSQKGWERLQQAAQSGFLPGVQAGLDALLTREPEIGRFLNTWGRAMGHMAESTGKALSSDEWAEFFGWLEQQAMPSITRLERIFGGTFRGLAGLLRGFTPLWYDMADGLGDLTDRFAAFGDAVASGRHQGFNEFLEQVREYGPVVFGVLGDLIGAAWNLATSLAPVGGVLLEVAGGILRVIEAAPPGVIMATTTALIGMLAAYKGITGIAAASAALGTFRGKVITARGAVETAGTALMGYAGNLRTLLTPSLLAATGPMQSFQSKVTNAGTRMGISEKAAGGFAGGLSKIGAAVPLLGTVLIGAALAQDAFSQSTDEATDAVLRGGKAADDARAAAAATTRERQLDNQALPEWVRNMREWIATNIDGKATTKSLNEELTRRRAEMNEVERAQSYATEAQGRYDQAVRDHGPNSREAAEANADLARRTKDVEIASIAARDGVDMATAAITRQRDEILAGLDANLRKRRADRELADSQKAYADAIAAGGANSEDAARKLEDLETAQLRAASAAKDSAGGQKAYNDTVAEMVAKGGPMSETLQGLVNGMDGAGLAAIGAKYKIDDTGRAVWALPDGRTIPIDVQNAAALTGLAGVRMALDAVPDGKPIVVSTLDQQARDQLSAIGFQVTNLPDGTVQVTANDWEARATLAAFQEFAAWQKANPILAADPAEADRQLRGFLDRSYRAEGKPGLSANPAEADRIVGEKIDQYNRSWGTIPVKADTQQADKDVRSWWQKTLDFFGGVFQDLFVPGAPRSNAQGGLVGHAAGGLVGYAAGGHLPHLAGGGGPGGLLVGPGTGTSDSIMARDPATGRPTAMVSNGEYVVRKRAVDALGVPTLDRLNGLARGGRVLERYAAGGGISAAASAAGGASGPAAPVVPVGDPAATTAAASATDLLTASLAGATDAAAVLDPTLAALAATQGGTLAPAQSAVTAGQQAMVSTGVLPLAAAVTGVLGPALAAYGVQVGTAVPAADLAMQTGQAATRASSVATAATTAATAAQQSAATTTAAATMQGQYSAVRQSQGVSVAANQALASNTQMATGRMTGDTGVMAANIGAHLAGVRGAQGTTASATTAFADAWRAQLGRLIPDSGDPARWVINYPIRGLTDAWNHLDGQFLLNKHVNPYVARFAEGGPVSGPGGPTADQVPAMLSDREFVVRAAVSDRVRPFLTALNSGQAEALQAAGAGRTPDPMVRLAAGGSVADAMNRAHTVARQMNGKPYVWGGFGPNGADCSGFQSIITNALRGEANIYRRIGTTASFPWAGFAPGLGGSYAVGAFKGNPGHMAGTLGMAAGGAVNVESGGSPSRVKYGAGAVGADNAQFNTRAFLPAVGGRFVSGGAGGGGVDIGPVVDEAFAKVAREIADVPRFFGPSPQVARDQGTAAFALGKVKEHATAKLSEMFAASGGGGNVEQWRGVVLQALGMVGQPPTMADTTLRRMNQESSGNPNIVNTWDSNARKGTPSVGLMQVIGPTYRANADPRHDVGPYVHGTSVDPLSNVLASMHYTLRKYGSLPAGYNRAGGYDNGGEWAPGTLGANLSGRVENVLTHEQGNALRDRIRGDSDAAAAVADRLDVLADAVLSQRPIVVHPRAEQSETSIATGIALEQRRRARAVGL